jgi:Ca-activated chloride channel family protein
MGLLWPFFLFLLLLIPAVVAAYAWMLRRTKRYAVQCSSLSLIRQAMPGGMRWRRHLPFALFLLALISLVVTSPGRWPLTASLPADQPLFSLSTSHLVCAQATSSPTA